MSKTRALMASVAATMLSASVASVGPSLAHPAGSPALAVGSMPAPSASAAALPADFNGDGFADLAVGVPFEGVGAVDDAGAVNVLYGSSTGLSATGSQLWHQNSPGVEGDGAEIEDGFGSSVAAGDFNGDGFSDLAVGIPSESVGNIFSAGAVNVLLGSSAGLTATGSQFWHQDSPGLVGDGAEDDDGFGSPLTTGDMNGDGFADLAVGVSGETIGSSHAAGAVNVLYGSASGLAALGSQFWHQNSPGIGGTAEFADFFGGSLATGDFTGDDVDDLSVGVPGEDLRIGREVGVVHVLYGFSDGLSATGSQIWHQDRRGIRGMAEGGDMFGSDLAAANFGRSPADDLAVGVPEESIGRTCCAGAVNVLYGSSSGLRAAGNQLWHQDSPGIAGIAEDSDSLGFSLAAAEFGKSSEDDLAVGAPFESVGIIEEAGAVNLLYGSSTGLSAEGDQLWHQGVADVLDRPEDFDLFGWSLAGVNFGHSIHADLAVGVPFEGIDDVPVAGAANVIYGSTQGLAAAGNQFWHQNVPDVQGDGAEEEDRFAHSLARKQ